MKEINVRSITKYNNQADFAQAINSGKEFYTLYFGEATFWKKQDFQKKGFNKINLVRDAYSGHEILFQETI